MGTEVLRPHDCLIERIRVPSATVFPRRRSFYNNNCRYSSHPTRMSRSKPAPVRSYQKKKVSEPSPAISRRYSSDDLRHSNHSHNHNHHHHHHHHQRVMGPVMILRRGEPLELKPATERLGSAPAMVPKQIQIKDPKTGSRSRSLSPKPVSGGIPDVYAGSAFSMSPSPESLPLPSFSKKKQVSMTVDDSATRDLRRLLRLD